MNILLSGPPFSGKTTIGNALGKLLNKKVIHTDVLIEEKYGSSCTDLYKKIGHTAFRHIENDLIDHLIQTANNTIISLGGGTLTYSKDPQKIKSIGTLIYLECDFNVLLQRLESSGKTPAYLDKQNKKDSFLKLIQERNQHDLPYADLTINVSKMTPEEAALAISKKLKTYKIDES